MRKLYSFIVLNLFVIAAIMGMVYIDSFGNITDPYSVSLNKQAHYITEGFTPEATKADFSVQRLRAK